MSCTMATVPLIITVLMVNLAPACPTNKASVDSVVKYRWVCDDNSKAGDLSPMTNVYRPDNSTIIMTQHSNTNCHVEPYSVPISELTEFERHQFSVLGYVRRRRQAMPSSPSGKLKVPLTQALQYITMYKLEKCSARLVCELYCDPDSLGSPGRELYTTIERFFTSGQPPASMSKDDVAFFTTARNLGIVHRVNKETCKLCYHRYNQCKRRSANLVQMATAVEIV